MSGGISAVRAFVFADFGADLGVGLGLFRPVDKFRLYFVFIFRWLSDLGCFLKLAVDVCEGVGL
ncbi:hypothetical protein [Ensifer adhaerens]|uniref:hypothetical protein n=1 Tax=Ensifer adhaerens TaxID=106592 RepID=UPI00128F2888|nr:hypothetical protein [Ensifer adhaerens]